MIVAVVDSGIDASHPDLAGAVLPGYDFVDEDADASDPPGSGHGTAVTGVAAARANNGIGGVGACFSCTVMPLRVLGPGGIAFNTNTAEAIDYAVDHGAAVVNVSLYGERSPRQLRGAVARARAAGVLVVAAAGNEANATPQYPAAFPEAISVASATSSGTLASFSSRGAWVKFAAPECAPITLLGGGQGVGCATSVSTPLVSGVIALMRAQAPFASAEDIENALARTHAPCRERSSASSTPLPRSARSAARNRDYSRPCSAMLSSGASSRRFAGIWAGSGLAVAYQWERCLDGVCTPIPDASRSRYTATAADGGRRLRVVVCGGGSRVGRIDADLARRDEAAVRDAALDRRAAARRHPDGRAARTLARRQSQVRSVLAALPDGVRASRAWSLVPRTSSRSRLQPEDRGHRVQLGRDRQSSQQAHASRRVATPSRGTGSRAPR